jgi:hypothetical protein
MNLSDLFVVVALASALYGVLMALAGRREFLRRAVNPYRGTWLLAAAGVFWVGVSLLRWEAGAWDPAAWADLVGKLISDAPTPPRVKAASLAFLFSLLQAILVGWCFACLPRDPHTFRDPRDRRAAFRYYVTRLRGGLDYAVLALGDGERLEEEADLRRVRAWCPHLPKLTSADGPRPRTPEEQVELWRKLAGEIHAHRAELDATIAGARQGRNRRLVFDLEFGGIFFKYLRLRDPRDELDTSLYLFGATLNQSEMDSGRAEQHFLLLQDALRHIDRSVRLG